MTKLRPLLSQVGSGTLARGAVWAFLIYATSAGLGYLLQTFLARTLPLHEYGAFTYVSTWAELISIAAGVGLSGAALRFIPTYKVSGQGDRLRAFITTSLSLTLVSALALGLVVYLVVSIAKVEGDLRLWVIAILLIPLYALNTHFMQMSRAMGRIVLSIGPPMVLRHVLLVAGCVALLLLNVPLTAEGVLALLALVMATVTIVIAVPFFRDVRPLVSGVQGSPDYRGWAGVAVPLFFGAIFVVLLSRTDLLLLGALRGAEEVAIYNVALKTAALVNFVTLALNATVAPRIAALHSQGDMVSLQRMITKTTGVIFWSSVAFAAGVVALGPWLLSIFGERFVEAYPALLVLTFGHVVAAAVGLVTNLLNMTGNQMRFVSAYGAAVVVCVALNLLLIPRWGLLGAAWATSLSYGGVNLVLFYFVRRYVGIHSSVFGRPALGVRD